MSASGVWSATMLALATFACASKHSTETTQVRDSAGVLIVTSKPMNTPQMVLDSAPRVLGADPDSGAIQLFRIGNVDEIRGGRFLVANRGVPELLLFADDGSLAARVGRRGQGPGEFVDLSLVRSIRGDTIIILDGATRRLSTFRDDGALIETHPVAMGFINNAVPLPVEVLWDGSVIVLGIRGAFNPNSDGSMLIRDTTSILRVSRAWDSVDTVLVLPGDENLRMQASSQGFYAAPRIFGKRLLVAARDSIIYVSNGDAAEIRSYALDGRYIQSLRLSIPSIPVDQDDPERFLREQPSRRTIYQRFLGATEYPAVFPPFSTLLTDDDGRLWVERYERPEENVHEWMVFNPAGAPLFRVSVPASFVLSSVRGNHLAGISRDSLGVESARIYSLKTAPN